MPFEAAPQDVTNQARFARPWSGSLLPAADSVDALGAATGAAAAAHAAVDTGTIPAGR